MKRPSSNFGAGICFFKCVFQNVIYKVQYQLFYEDKDGSILDDLYDAYLDCRRNKRNKISALKFELNLETNLFLLYDDLMSSNYCFSPCNVFMVKKPVQREIFAADFRDRIVHHFLINKLNPYFEKLFVNGSFACRVGKGTHYGINTIRKNLKMVTQNFTEEAWVLKLDIKGFFMHINRTKLSNRLETFVGAHYEGSDKQLVMQLLREVAELNPSLNCIVRGDQKEWVGLPNDKSLFHSPAGCGLPIGSLTSQVFANFYLHSLDEYVIHTLGVHEYGRYVDDFVLVHKSKEYLKECLVRIKAFLYEELDLTLHPKKIYFQKADKGIPFLGVFIRPKRIYCGKRMKSGFYDSMMKYNSLLKSNLCDDLVTEFISSMNSYLGMMSHFESYNLRKKMISKNLDPQWWRYVALTSSSTKFVRRRKSAFANARSPQ